MFPLQPKPTVLIAKAAILLIWVLAAAIMCPAAVVLTVEQVPHQYMVYNDDFIHTLPLYTCYENFTNPRMRRVYTVVLFVLIYLVPLTVITFMYGSIGVKLCASVLTNREQQLVNVTVGAGGRRGGQPMISQKKIMVIKMLIMVTLLFMLSWLPLWTLMMMTDYAGLDRDQVDILTGYIFPFAHWLAFSNSSINPIIYGYYNENFKMGFQAVYKSRVLCCLTKFNLGERIANWGRKERSVEAPHRREYTDHDHHVLRVRNRVHNTEKLSDAAEVNKSARARFAVVHLTRDHSDRGLEMAAVHKKDSKDEELQRVSSPAGSVYTAWEN